MMEACGIEWAAGIIEGEGSIGFHRDPSRIGGRGTSVSVKMTDEDVVRRLFVVLGVGNVNGPYQSSYPGAKPIWQWAVYAKDDVTNVLDRLLPFLGARRKAKAVEILEFVKTQTKKPIEFCKHGHAYTPENTYRWVGRGRRSCKACQRTATLKWQAKRRSINGSH